MKRLLALLLLLAGPALAGNGIAGITVAKYRNLTSAAIEAIVSGDDDSSAVLYIFQKPLAVNARFDTGMVMVRRTGSTIYEGRILRMSPTVTMQFYVIGVDADGGFRTPTDTVSCAVVTPIVATGTVLYVAKSGADVNPGTLASPKLTINGALTAMRQLSDSGARGGVIVRPGEYHERIDLNFGVDGAPRFIMGDGTNPDSTIICGANEEVETGNAAVGTAIAWTKIDPSDGPDSVYWTPFPAGDSTQNVILGWSEMLHRKPSLKALYADSTANTATGASTNAGEISGWYWGAGGTADSLYVKRRNGASPAGITLHAGYRDNLCIVSRSNWHISNLTFRFSGSLTSQSGLNQALWTDRINPGMTGVGISCGSVVGNSHHTTIDSCRFIGLNSASILLNIGAGSPNKRADSCTVTNCKIDGLGPGLWFYGASKSLPNEGSSQMIIRSFGTSVCNNFITGTFNGIGMDSGDQTDSVTARFCEFSGNYMKDLEDDALELDSSHNVNSLYMGNTIRNTGSGFSLCAFSTGPAFMFFNYIVQFKFRGVKACGGQVGLSRFYNNTFTSTSAGDPTTTGCWAIDASPGGQVDNMEFRNNIIIARRAQAVVYANSTQLNTFTNSFNYNLLDSLQSTRLVSLNGTGYSLATLRSTLSWEGNGVQGAAGFADSTRNWQLLPTSTALTGGRRITGVNTDPSVHPRSSAEYFMGATGVTPWPHW